MATPRIDLVDVSDLMGFPLWVRPSAVDAVGVAALETGMMAVSVIVRGRTLTSDPYEVVAPDATAQQLRERLFPPEGLQLDDRWGTDGDASD